MGVDAHTFVTVFGAQQRNVGCLSVYVFKTRSGPANTRVPHPWIQGQQALPSWVSCVGSLMESPLQLPTQLSQLEGAPGGWVVGRL